MGAEPQPVSQVYLGAGAPHNTLQELHRFPALRSLDVPAAACPEGELPGFAQSLEELTLREGVSPGLLRWAPDCGGWAEMAGPRGAAAQL